jgi:hypothetical protein
MLARQKKIDPNFPKGGYDKIIFQETCQSIDIQNALKTKFNKLNVFLYIYVPIGISISYFYMMVIYASVFTSGIVFFLYKNTIPWSDVTVWIRADFVLSLVFLFVLVFIVCCIYFIIIFGYGWVMEENRNNKNIYLVVSIIIYVTLFLINIKHLTFCIYYIRVTSRQLLNIPSRWTITFIGINMGFLGVTIISTICMILFIIGLKRQIDRLVQSINALLGETGETNVFANINIQETIVNVCTESMKYNPFNEQRPLLQNNIYIKQNV